VAEDLPGQFHGLYWIDPNRSILPTLAHLQIQRSPKQKHFNSPSLQSPVLAEEMTSATPKKSLSDEASLNLDQNYFSP